MAAISTPSIANRPGMCRARVLAPAPIKPMRMGLGMVFSSRIRCVRRWALFIHYNNVGRIAFAHPQVELCMSSKASLQANSVPAPATQRQPMTVPDFMSAKLRGIKLTMLTAYDYTLARLLDDAGVDAILVGDSLGMVMQGEPHSLRVTLDEMIYHTKLVARGVRHSLLITDLPFMSYQVSPQQAL